ncbi:FeoB-associated Cys-rich membrane protein [uncultured Tenacibaculum sp.]|uniref:FeoB-associated Cys-rich membrane protein n=1 Tax=uncultured Tenacibaculum sp. TaxID=174713 RepID=UPI0034462EB6
MAINTIIWNGSFSIHLCIINISNFTIMTQEIITYSIVILAVLFLGRKFIFKSKKDGCGPDCGCS